jgi:hypothetical protein
MTDSPNGLSLINLDLKTIWNTADRISLISLLVANLVPIFVAVVFHWDVTGVVVFYWIENLIIGFWSICRIAMARGRSTGLPGSGGKYVLVPFFAVHYFLFCAVHGFFIGLLFSGVLDRFRPMGSAAEVSLPGIFARLYSGSGLLATGSVLLAIAGIFISHGISFQRNYLGKGEYKTARPETEMFRPYGRIVLMHVSILFGGILVVLFGAPLFFVILLMIGKTLMDAAAHVASHQPGSGKAFWEKVLRLNQTDP